GSRLATYAQRQGDLWTDRRHRPLPAPAGGWLEGLTHARVRQFIDDAETASRLLPAVLKKPLYRAGSPARPGKPTQLSVGTGGGMVLGAVSSRPGAVFELYPESIALFEQYAMLGKGVHQSPSHLRASGP